MLFQLLNFTREMESRPKPAHVRLTNRNGKFDIYHTPPEGVNSTLNVSYRNGKMRIFSEPDGADLYENKTDTEILELLDYLNSSSAPLEPANSQLGTSSSFYKNPKGIRFYLILN